MLNPKLKIYATGTLIALSIVPKLGYHASKGYIQGYERTSSYIEDCGTKILQTIGLQHIPDNENRAQLIADAGSQYHLNPKLITAVMAQESAGREDSFSPKQAIGLMQIMPSNAKRCGLPSASRLWDEKTNIFCGARILSEELLTYKGNLRKALESYNGGSRLVGKSSETAAYSQSVINKFAQNLVQ